MDWKIEHIFNFSPDRPWGQGCCNFGFHGASGAQYVLMHSEHWLGCLSPDDTFLWTAGAVNPGLCPAHMGFPLQNPFYLCELPDGSQLVSSHGTNQIFRICPDRQCADLFADTGRVGLKDLGNCVFDGRESVWVNEIEGGRVWQFRLTGEPVQVLGNGQAGFNPGCVPYEEARFSAIYDLRAGPDGCIYVLDSKNYSVRRVDPLQRTVTTVVGTGQPGYTGDGGFAQEATLGSTPGDGFDGPYALAVDVEGSLFIGDTQNRVVRMMEAQTQQIKTIAGHCPAEPGLRCDPAETDPLRLNLPLISSLDYHAGRLYIPDASGDLVVLIKR